MSYNPYDNPIASDFGPLLRLDGKVAIVTGSAQRIGREIARVYAAQGAKVIVSDVQDERGEQVAQELRGRGGEAAYVHCDVSQPDQIRDLVDSAIRLYGRLDILVNNAHWEKRGSVVDIEEADWDKSFDVLLKAHYLGCKFAIPHMQKVGGGAIVNISSVHAFHTADNYVTYDTAKAAVLHFTQQVAWDFGPSNIRVNAICPGAIPIPEDAAQHLADPLWMAQTTLTNPTKRPGHPRDIAFAALYLVSDLATWVTGTHFVVDGGEFNGFVNNGSRRMRNLLKEHPELLEKE